MVFVIIFGIIWVVTTIVLIWLKFKAPDVYDSIPTRNRSRPNVSRMVGRSIVRTQLRKMNHKHKR